MHEKWSKNSNTHFMNEKKQMANYYMKSWYVSLVIREMKM